MEIYAIEDQGEFIGLAMNMIWGDMGLLDYFAIAENKRNSGYGSRCIRLLLERFKDRKYIFEIEKQDEQAENSADRKRRKAFYLRNGLKETGVFANVYQVDFELLTPEGNLTFEEYSFTVVMISVSKIMFSHISIEFLFLEAVLTVIPDQPD